MIAVHLIVFDRQANITKHRRSFQLRSGFDTSCTNAELSYSVRVRFLTWYYSSQKLSKRNKLILTWSNPVATCTQSTQIHIKWVNFFADFDCLFQYRWLTFLSQRQCVSYRICMWWQWRNFVPYNYASWFLPPSYSPCNSPCVASPARKPTREA